MEELRELIVNSLDADTLVDILDIVWEDKESGEKKSKSLYFQIEHLFYFL